MIEIVVRSDSIGPLHEVKVMRRGPGWTASRSVDGVEATITQPPINMPLITASEFAALALSQSMWGDATSPSHLWVRT